MQRANARPWVIHVWPASNKACRSGPLSSGPRYWQGSSRFNLSDAGRLAIIARILAAIGGGHGTNEVGSGGNNDYGWNR